MVNSVNSVNSFLYNINWIFKNKNKNKNFIYSKYNEFGKLCTLHTIHN